MGRMVSSLLFLLQLCSIQAEILRYEMLISEEPVKIVQVVTFDEEAGLRLVDVPKHRNLMKTLHVTDLQDVRLSLQVVEEMESCFIGKPRQHLNPKDEKEALGNFTKQFNSHLVFSSSHAVHQELIFLAGAHITHEELPAKLRAYCPSNYRVQTFRYIDKEKQVITVSQSGEMFIQDPNIQKDYKTGDQLMTEEDILPEGLKSVSRRVKRAPNCLAMDDDGQLVNSGCAWVQLSCQSTLGCPGNHVYYTCKSNPPGSHYISCEYILLCSIMNNNDCAVHATSTAYRCVQCCISDNCGPSMRKCSEGTKVDASTRKLIMKINIYKETDKVVYENDGAQISLYNKERECSTGILPTVLPVITLRNGTIIRKTQVIRIDTSDVLGTCYRFNVSSEVDKETLRIELKLPNNSPISVTKVKVFDEQNPLRCWIAKWKPEYGNHNMQNNQWVAGTKTEFDDDCTI